jgi:hypothetical protein
MPPIPPLHQAAMPSCRHRSCAPSKGSRWTDTSSPTPFSTSVNPSTSKAGSERGSRSSLHEQDWDERGGGAEAVVKDKCQRGYAATTRSSLSCQVISYTSQVTSERRGGGEGRVPGQYLGERSSRKMVKAVGVMLLEALKMSRT